MKKIILYYALIIVCFVSGCVASGDGGDTSKNTVSSVDIPMGQVLDLSIATTDNYKTVKLPSAKLHAFFQMKFEDSGAFKNFKIISQDEKNFYVTASGIREKAATEFGVELEVDDKNLVLQDFNKLFYTCIGRYCKSCAFKFNNDGTIGGCNCGETTEEPPKGYTACEHTIAIKTSDKE